MSLYLNESALADLPDGVEAPGYDRSKVKTGIVHIGPGAFFRGHIALYIDDLLRQGDTRWGITAVSLKSSAVRDTLKAQDNLYTVVEQKPTGHSARIVGSIKEVLVAKEEPALVLERMTDPNVKLVTLTVTQSGYYYDPKTKQLDFDHPDIQESLDTSTDALATVGWIVAALERRKEAGIEPFTVMSCDNIPGNGNVLRNVVLAYAGRQSQELMEWIAQNVSFPNTMVDRIVPKLQQQQRDYLEERFGVNDAWPIYTERFRQWVVENEFSGDVPDFSAAGVLVAEDVYPYELMKIRLLNGIHLAMGVIGYLSGYEYSHEAISDPAIRSFVGRFFDEVKADLPPVPGVNLDQYTDALIERLMNPYMKDELTRLARNGSQKVPTRLIDPIREAIAHNENYDDIAFALAAWIIYLRGVDGKGNAFDISDEEAFRTGLHDLSLDCNGRVCPILSVSGIFGYDLPANSDFSSKVMESLSLIEEKGMAGALRELYYASLGPQQIQAARSPSQGTIRQQPGTRI